VCFPASPPGWPPSSADRCRSFTRAAADVVLLAAPLALGLGRALFRANKEGNRTSTGRGGGALRSCVRARLNGELATTTSLVALVGTRIQSSGASSVEATGIALTWPWLRVQVSFPRPHKVFWSVCSTWGKAMMRAPPLLSVHCVTKYEHIRSQSEPLSLAHFTTIHRHRHPAREEEGGPLEGTLSGGRLVILLLASCSRALQQRITALHPTETPHASSSSAAELEDWRLTLCSLKRRRNS